MKGEQERFVKDYIPETIRFRSGTAFEQSDRAIT